MSCSKQLNPLRLMIASCTVCFDQGTEFAAQQGNLLFTLDAGTWFVDEESDNMAFSKAAWIYSRMCIDLRALLKNARVEAETSIGHDGIAREEGDDDLGQVTGGSCPVWLRLSRNAETSTKFRVTELKWLRRAPAKFRRLQVGGIDVAVSTREEFWLQKERKGEGGA